MESIREEHRLKWRLHLSGSVRRFLAMICVVALVVGLLITQFFYGQMMDMRAQAEQLRGVNSQIYNQNVALLAQRARLTSKDRIVAVAAVKLNLFEPDQGQVRRM
jgi:cell division protein FtsL